MESAARIGVSAFVHIGSYLEYEPQDRPLREQDPLRPGTFRGMVKAACSLLCRHYSRQEGIPTAILRVFSAYGPWEAPGRLIPSAFLAAVRDRPLPLTPPGIRHDLIHIADVVEACLRAARPTSKGCTEVNIGTGRAWSNETVVRFIEDIVGRKIETHPEAYPLRDVDLNQGVADTARARKVLAWRPRFSLKQGLAHTYTWLTQNPGMYGQLEDGGGRS
jgi:nucleoside-diphosphate-sugar epimerase